MDPSAKKARGRPPGSKNKASPSSLPMPKPDESSMKVFNFTVPPNRDIMEFIFDIAHKDNVNVTILSASGKINSVILRNSTDDTTQIMMHGPFTLLSLSGSYLYNNHNTLHSGPTPPFPLSFGINISTSHGELLGGVIGGSLISGEDVSVTVSTFKNPQRYENNNNNDNITSGDFSEGGNLLGLEFMGE
ncbi:hypothetical protein PHAVU_006G031100 [Phaseolus vulgaris]|uniref:PPC domain-containing protein n=1 Tax=Phaseolus vulgaris TaxID=3885 RepID=V7BK37_PHAVU|nr:hypothetical protein PHAVU_006G031100g [Phaseolus vulgaris]ESW18322.1 hypothetical protein PHAVU_006G031100g [Phaseolus vulgaris]